jgi:hypothetical protein
MKQTPQKSSKTDDNSPWMKWAYVGIALLFAVAMVGTYMSPLFSNTQKVQAGNTVQIGYTIRNEAGRTLITTDQNLASSEYEKGNVVLLTSGMEIPAGAQVSGEDIVVLPVLYPNVTGYSGFGLIGFEVDAISEGLVGMRTGETKTVSLSYGTNDLEMNLSEEDATASASTSLRSPWATWSRSAS